MDHEIHASHRLHEPLAVAHVADEKPHRVARKVLPHVELLELVARVHDDPARLEPSEKRLRKLTPERAGAAGDQDGLAVEHAGLLPIR